MLLLISLKMCLFAKLILDLAGLIKQDKGKVWSMIFYLVKLSTLSPISSVLLNLLALLLVLCRGGHLYFCVS